VELTFLIQLAPELLKLAKAASQRLFDEPPVARAISATDSAVRDVECAPALRKWCGSDAFLALLKEIERGKDPLTGDAVLEAFVVEGQFYFEDVDQTRIKAREVLEFFFAALHKNLLGGSEALVYLDARTQQAIRDQTSELKGYFGGVSGPGSVTQAASADAGSVQGIEPQLQAQIDLARTLLDQGKYVSAQQILEAIRRDVEGHAPSEELLFRIAANLGACFLALGDPEVSEREYRLAHELRPDEPKIFAALARAALNRGSVEEALELSESGLKKAPRNPHVAGTYLLSLYRLGREAAVDEFIEDNRWFLAEPIGAGTVAEIRFEQGRFDAAEELLLRALGGSEVDTPAARTMLAVTITTPIQNSLRENPPLEGIPEETDNRLAEAELELTRAIDTYKSQEAPARLLDAEASRAGVRAMRGELDAALEDANRVLLEDADHRVALLNRAMILLRMNRYAEASEDLDRLVSDRPDDQALSLLWALSLAGSERETEAVETLESIWDAQSTDIIQVEIADVLLRSAAGIDDAETVERVLEEVRTSATPPSLRKAVVARQLIRQREIEAAVALLEEALSEADQRDRLRVQRELAEAYFLAERFPEAARLYSDFVDTTRDSPGLRSYLAALFNAGHHGQALEIAQGIRRGGQAIPVVSEVEARVLAFIGDLNPAVELYLELASVERDKPNHIIEAATLRFRQGDREASRQLVRSVSIDSIRDDSSALLMLAELKLLLEEHGALELAYRARRLDFDSAHVHGRYMFLMLNSETLERELLSVDTVKADTSARLRRDDETRLITIVDDDLTSRARNEVRSTEPLAEHLLGKSVGDRVVLREGMEDLEYEVVEIQSKYVAAFQETLLNFSTWFPDEDQLQRVDVRENDFSRIFAAVDARHEWAQRVTAWYRTRPATIGVLSSLLGSSPIDVWVGLVGLEETRFIVAAGVSGEVQEAAEALSDQDEIVVDLTSVLTLAHLGLLEQLKTRFNRLVCSQSVVDALTEHIEVNYKGATPSGTLAKRGESYVHIELTPEDIDRGRRHVESIVSFLQESASIEPVREALTLDPERMRELADLIGQDALDSILLAKEKECLLYADDLRLRQLAKGELGVDGVWIQPILSHLRARNHISEDERRDAIVRLLLSNYVFISIDGDDLLAALGADELRRTPRNERLLARVLGSETSLESAVAAAAAVIRGVWLENLIDARKVVMLDLVLESLLAGRGARRPVLQELVSALQVRLRLIPLAFVEVARNIEAWAQGHAI
jgi:tetratricopeptide (TPR) repeat protein/predicted nucleic acid-binding protein